MTSQGQLVNCEQNIFWRSWPQQWTVENLLEGVNDKRHIMICMWDNAWQNLTILPIHIPENYRDKLSDTVLRFSVVSHSPIYIKNKQTIHEKHFGEFIEFRLEFPNVACSFSKRAVV